MYYFCFNNLDLVFGKIPLNCIKLTKYIVCLVHYNVGIPLINSCVFKLNLIL